MRTLEDDTFLLLIIAVSLAFAWILWPFYGAILWGTVLATVFAPLHRRLSSSMPQRCNLAALATVLIIVTMVILPLMLIAASLLQEATGLYKRIQSGELDFGRSFQQFREALPPWATSLLDRFGLTDLRGVLERLSAGLMKGSQFIAAQALTIGQSTVDFVVSLFLMLYLLFFLLRDGDALAKRIKDAVPLRADQKHALFGKFATVIRATVKGDILVAVLQGTLGGIIFWVLDIYAPVLWAVVMAFLSLLPAVGTASVWLPVAIYLLATGSGHVLVASRLGLDVDDLDRLLRGGARSSALPGLGRNTGMRRRNSANDGGGLCATYAQEVTRRSARWSAAARTPQTLYFTLVGRFRTRVLACASRAATRPSVGLAPCSP